MPKQYRGDTEVMYCAVEVGVSGGPEDFSRSPARRLSVFLTSLLRAQYQKSNCAVILKNRADMIDNGLR